MWTRSKLTSLPQPALASCMRWHGGVPSRPYWPMPAGVWAFLDQEFEAAQRVVDTNISGTIYLIHKVGRDMRARGAGRIL